MGRSLRGQLLLQHLDDGADFFGVGLLAVGRVVEELLVGVERLAGAFGRGELVGDAEVVPGQRVGGVDLERAIQELDGLIGVAIDEGASQAGEGALVVGPLFDALTSSTKIT